MKNKEFVIPIAVGSVLSILFSIIAFLINKSCGFITILLAAILLLIFFIYTKKRYKKINELNNYLSLVCRGDYTLNVSENTEGELSILKNNLYKVVSLLKNSNENLINDKIYLADSLADISHQLKTPLTSVMVITDLLKQEEDTEKRNEFVSIIENQCDKMKWLITTLLKLSKLDAGTVEFVKSNVKASEIIDCSLKAFMLSIDLKNIKLIKNIQDFEFTGDKNWTVEALENIVKNCIEHTDENSVLRIETSSNTLHNQIIIEDNGSGISKKDLPHIFERFYRGDNVNPESVGIGLALSKEILKNQNASVSVESEEGKGSRFTIKFYKSVV